MSTLIIDDKRDAPVSDDKRDVPLSDEKKEAPISDDKRNSLDLAVEVPTLPTSSTPPSRPQIVFTSVPALFQSLGSRFASVWTRRFVLSLLAGQLLSLCITCTNVTTTELVKRNWALPTTQSFFLYVSICFIYTPYTIYRYGFKGWGKMVLRDGWKYLLLSAVDVEANFVVVKAFQHTDLLSCMLLAAWSTPVCMVLCYFYLKTKYHWTQILGVLICIGGLGLLVTSDSITDKNYPASNRRKGDAFMILGATLYGISNATEEFFVRRSPLYEVVGQMGFWGIFINGIQASALEHKGMRTSSWNKFTIGLLVAYTGSMTILYTVAPLLYRMASSVYFNLSLLTADFYGLLFGLFLYHYSPYYLYFLAFTTVLVGLIVYFWHATPEGQGKLDPKPPAYILNVRGRQEPVADVTHSGQARQLRLS